MEKGLIAIVEQREGEDLFTAIRRTVREHLDRDEQTPTECGSIGACAPEPEHATVDFMDFGDALKRLRYHRARIARNGWNGKDQYITKIPAGNACYQGCYMQDCLGLKNTRGEMQPGWVPSQGDLFAEDWYVVE